MGRLADDSSCVKQIPELINATICIRILRHEIQITIVIIYYREVTVAMDIGRIMRHLLGTLNHISRLTLLS